jgi:hypothetical protein
VTTKSDRKLTNRQKGLLAAVVVVLVLLVGGYAYVRSILSAEGLARLLNNAVGPATSGVYRITIEDADIRLLTGNATIHGVSVVTDAGRLGELEERGEAPALRVDVTIESLQLRGLSALRLILQRDFIADSIVVDDAEVLVTLDPALALVPATADAEDAAGPAETQEAAGSVAALSQSPAERIRAALEGIPTIAVGRVALGDAGLQIDTLAADPETDGNGRALAARDVVGTIDIELLDLRIAADATIDEVRNLYTDDIRVRVAGVETRRIGNNILRLGEMTASSKGGEIRFDGLAFEAVHTIAEYLERATIAEGDRVNVLVDSLTIEGFSFADYMQDLSLLVRDVEVDGFRADILSDKRKPKRQRTEPAPMPHDFFRALDSILTIERITLRNGEVSYSEQAPDGIVPGTLSFREVTGRVTNVSNDPTRMSEATPALLEATTRVNDAASANVQWALPLLSPRPTMTSRGQIAAFDPTTLNPMLEPLLGVRVSSGQIDGVTFEFRYSPERITGELDAFYRGLRVQIVDKKTGDRNLGRKILGFVANAIAIRSSNPARPGEAPRQGTLDMALEPTDPFFKLIWIAIRDAMADIAARIG